MWIIQGVVSSGDYLRAIVPGHPSATRHGYVLLHRVLMENHLGRLLTDDEIVHHIDHDKRNNHISNLEVMSKAEHARIHGYEQGIQYILFQCPHCGQLFYREARASHWIKRNNIFTACSRSCGASFGNYLSNNGINWYASMVLEHNIQGWFTKNNPTGEFIEY